MRVRRSLLNFGTLILFTGVTTAIAFYATPKLVLWLGEKKFGAFRIVNDGYGYLTLLELGLGGAVGPLLARAVGQDDREALRETVAAGAWAYGKVSIVTAAIGLAATPLVPWLATDLSGSDVSDLKTAWVVGLVSFLSLGLMPFRAVVDARQLGYLVNLLLTVQAVSVTGLSLWLARAGWGVTGQATALAAGAWGFNLVLALAVLRDHPGLFRAVVAGPTRPEILLDLRRLSWPALLINLSGRMSLFTDSMIVGGILGTRRVTSLYTTQRLASLGQTILQGIGSATWAALAELHARGDRSTFNRRLIELSRLIAILSAGGLAPVVAYNRAFVRIWMGPNFDYAGDLVIVFAAINVILLAEQSLWAWCFSATGNLGYLVVPGVAAAVVNLSASLVLTHQIGIAGPIIGTTIGCTAVGLWALPRLLKRVFETSPLALAKAVGLPAAWGTLASAALYGLTRYHQPESWLTLGLEMSVAAVIVLGVAFLLFMPADEREHWRTRLAAMRVRRSSP